MYKYSIVTAVYNVEPYLKNFFQSIIHQTLDFQKNIQLIIVNDGSTDQSEEIIQTWKEKYPNNILYIKKENGGQSSARNLGLQYVHAPWVTFIDPDDFIKKDYFLQVDSMIQKNMHNQLVMVGCHIEYYFEKFKLYLDKHPLNYKFKHGNSIYAIKHLENNIQLSASSAFFKTDIIKSIKLTFSTKVKPNFEDAHFVNTYLIENFYTGIVAFLKDAKYYYRRRNSKNSTIDTAWTKKELYDDVLRFGCQDLFLQAEKKLGFTPSFLQWTILYHLSWYYKNILRYPQTTLFLSPKEQNTFYTLLEKLFNFIDIRTIEKFNLSNIEEYIKMGWILLYKNQLPSYQIIYIYQKNNKLYCSYYADSEKHISVYMDNTLYPVITSLEYTYLFSYKPFIHKYSFIIPIKSKLQQLTIKANNTKTFIKTGNRKYFQTIPINKIYSTTIIELKEKLHYFIRSVLVGN
jgi:glycosyltransferase involved in cell wall biosynthesis